MALACLVLVWPAAAAVERPSCLSAQAVLERARIQSPGLQILRWLRGSPAVALVAAYNALPPVSDVQADQVVIVSAPWRPDRRTLLFAAGACLVAYGHLPAPVLEALLDRLGRQT